MQNRAFVLRRRFIFIFCNTQKQTKRNFSDVDWTNSSFFTGLPGFLGVSVIAVVTIVSRTFLVLVAVAAAVVVGRRGAIFVLAAVVLVAVVALCRTAIGWRN